MRLKHKKRDLKVKVNCDECGKILNPQGLKQHKEAVHKAQPKILRCKPKTFALTGDTQQIRPFLILLLQKKGFTWTENVTKGTFALVFGSQHTPEKAVEAHWKYR
jgi:methionyl-tRNA synthetase